MSENENEWLLVTNIPQNFKISDLRRFFTTFVEGNEFALFNYQYRKAETGDTCQCFCLLKSTDKLRMFLKKYHRKFWINRKEQEQDSKCLIRTDVSPPSTALCGPSDSYMTRQQQKEQQASASATASQMGRSVNCVDRVLLSELFPLPGLPQGTVGTPLKVVHRHVDKLPPFLLKDIELDPFRFYNMKFKYDYTDEDNLFAPVHFPGDDDEKLQAAATNDSDAEEWDREDAVNPELDKGRGLGKIGDERLFEKEVENPWDKGDASSLVFYTDAFYWDQHKGDFDERTADFFDVDPENPHSSRPVKFKDNFQYMSQEVAAKLMRRMGWREGKGIGKYEQGLKKPIPVTVRLDNSGIGAPNPSKRKKHPGKQSSQHKRRKQEEEEEEEEEVEEDDGDDIFERDYVDESQSTQCQLKRRHDLPSVTTIYDQPPPTVVSKKQMMASFSIDELD